jgi:hypothetical protein
MRRKKLWRVWAKALGSKESNCDKEADTVAIVRTFIFASYLITNVAICANAVRHWNRGLPNESVRDTVEYLQRS